MILQLIKTVLTTPHGYTRLKKAFPFLKIILNSDVTYMVHITANDENGLPLPVPTVCESLHTGPVDALSADQAKDLMSLHYDLRHCTQRFLKLTRKGVK